MVNFLSCCLLWTRCTHLRSVFLSKCSWQDLLLYICLLWTWCIFRKDHASLIPNSHHRLELCIAHTKQLGNPTHRSSWAKDQKGGELTLKSVLKPRRQNNLVGTPEKKPLNDKLLGHWQSYLLSVECLFHWNQKVSITDILVSKFSYSAGERWMCSIGVLRAAYSPIIVFIQNSIKSIWPFFLVFFVFIHFSFVLLWLVCLFSLFFHLPSHDV